MVIFDFLEKNPFLNNKLRDDIKQTSDYVYLKLFQFVMIDKDNSKYNTRYGDFEIIKPEEGLAPIFRIRQLPERVFVTEDVCRAIQEYNAKTENKVKGIRLYKRFEYINF